MSSSAPVAPQAGEAPCVSVVIPVYNSQTYLAEALDSVLAQSFTDFELLAIDDGSSDGSPDILRRYQQKDPRVVVIRQDNAGVAAACNTGVQAARGRYIARMDADDICWPERFARQVAALEADPGCVALGSSVRLIDAEGRVLKNMAAAPDHADIDRRLITHEGFAICHPTVIMRTEAVRRIGGYRSDFPKAEDADLFLQLAEIGRLANLPEVLLDYRQHFASVGNSNRLKQMLDAWNAAKAAAQRRGVPFDIPEPTADHAQRGEADICRKWGWWALSSGSLVTARHYARQAVKSEPLSYASWRLMLFALRGK